VPETVELARMVVEDEQAPAERLPREGEPVGEEEEGRKRGATHDWR
jgi:hypothetical protein